MVARDTLVGRWLRAPELDSGQGRTFVRDQGRPSRPRAALELRDDGTYEELRVGPADRGAAAPGHWRVDGTTLTLTASGTKAQPQHLEVVDAGPERLVLGRSPNHTIPEVS